MTTKEQVLALEYEAIAHWAGGNALGYLMHAADDLTYFDDIGANRGLVGLEAVTSHFKVIAEMVPEHNYKLSGINMQILGITAVLMYNYDPTTLEGEPSTAWRATIVYSKYGDEWKVAHMHWTMHKEG